MIGAFDKKTTIGDEFTHRDSLTRAQIAEETRYAQHIGFDHHRYPLVTTDVGRRSEFKRGMGLRV